MHYEQPFHRCCPVQTPDRFGLFQRLPAEIRNMIWEYSLPESRVYEVLDAPNAKQKTQAQKGLMFANVHPEPPPALAAVCRESRYFVLHHYKPLTLGSTTKYVDLSRDILLLEPYLLVKRLHRTLHFMSQIPLVRDNINRLALGTSYGVYTGICHPVLSWKVSKNNMGKLLSTLAKFPKLKLLIFVVHQEFQFEFDYRFPGTLTPIPNHPQAGYLSSATPIPPNFGHGATNYPSPANSHNSSRVGATLAPLPSQASTPRPAPPQSPTTTLTGYPSPITTGYPSPTSSQQQQQSQSQQPPQPRPQLVHQAYRFKFDIEANINHTPRRPHLNELLYYPLDIDEDKEDWDLGVLGTEESEWCDPWPTNDDWRRFRKRFQRAINLSLEMGLAEGGDGERAPGKAKGKSGMGKEKADVWCAGERRDCWGTGGGSGSGKGEGEGRKRMQIPALKGASLLWRYQRV
ncbi:hypothetical protein B0T14DRAFT_415476 [Immersiella caudata]|uniref:2EXR domain-containing protein n=1 Tax=Immersiella caudata TaxID=314043 RepID=A0AA39XE74_9PEZI|nr:hypothetical protein B0T14DRAFT_415476 [Immersiella caudata]